MSDWAKSGACRDKPHDWWFPSPQHNPIKAVEICMHCPVRIECLTFALRTNQEHGVWGGLTSRERRDPRLLKVGYTLPVPLSQG